MILCSRHSSPRYNIQMKPTPLGDPAEGDLFIHLVSAAGVVRVHSPPYRMTPPGRGSDSWKPSEGVDDDASGS